MFDRVDPVQSAHHPTQTDALGRADVHAGRVRGRSHRLAQYARPVRICTGPLGELRPHPRHEVVGTRKHPTHGLVPAQQFEPGLPPGAPQHDRRIGSHECGAATRCVTTSSDNRYECRMPAGLSSRWRRARAYGSPRTTSTILAAIMNAALLYEVTVSSGNSCGAPASSRTPLAIYSSPFAATRRPGALATA